MAAKEEMECGPTGLATAMVRGAVDMEEEQLSPISPGLAHRKTRAAAAIRPHQQKQPLLEMATVPPSVRPLRVAGGAKSQPPGDRCGEIFVAKRARFWTFVCTYCEKRTRDIGEFICHLQRRHLATAQTPDHSDGESDSLDEAPEEDGQEEQPLEDDEAPEEVSKLASFTGGGKNFRLSSSRAVEIIPLNYKTTSMPRPAAPIPPVGRASWERSIDDTPIDSTEYLDCGNYLDVSFHTGSEELSYNERRPSARKDKPKKSVHYADLLESQMDDESLKREKLGANGDPSAQTNLKRPRRKQTPPPSILDFNGLNAKQSMDSMDESPDFSRPVENLDMLIEHTYNPNEEPDCDEDFDGPVMTSSGDPSDTSGGTEAKSKRRQIRGTAFCTLCNKTFQYYSLYRNHMIKHSTETPYKCALCKKGFKSKQAIRYHLNTHMKHKQFKCTICYCGFYTENQYITHMATHESETLFPCTVCGRILHSDKERTQHLAMHTEERPFQCEFCQKLFRLRHHLSNHLKMHRQYRCDYCREKFPSNTTLRKPYACQACEQLPEIRAQGSGIAPSAAPAAALQDALNVDEAASDSDAEPDREGDAEEGGVDTILDTPDGAKKKRFSCSYCQRKYSHLGGLNYHIRTKHSQ